MALGPPLGSHRPFGLQHHAHRLVSEGHHQHSEAPPTASAAAVNDVLNHFDDRGQATLNGHVERMVRRRGYAG